MVDNSPWPFFLSAAVFIAATGTVMYCHSYSKGWFMLCFGFGLVFLVIGVWCRDIVREGTYEGNHTSVVQYGLRQAMLLFIVSEVMFFVSFFWSYLWVGLSPAVEIGSIWAPAGIVVFSPWGFPLLNTVILLLSGVTITFSHHSVLGGSRYLGIVGLFVTFILSFLFTFFQGVEYCTSGFSISDSVYGSVFFICTGFHGFHVLVGTVMIVVSLVRFYRYEFTSQHHFGFEAAIWYWHFVDVVWILLFVVVYWWGGLGMPIRYGWDRSSIKSFTLNFGPQHPAAHGVLRLVLGIDGEYVVFVDPHIGLLHRGTEKLTESKSFVESIPYMDRLDYVSMMAQEHTYVLSLEKLGQVVVSNRVSWVRVIFLEITRLLNHLLAVSCHALDVGAMTAYFWGFEEREKLMEFYERVSGARMHSFYFRVGGLLFDLPLKLLEDIYVFCIAFRDRLDEIEELLTLNRIWRDRLVGIGSVTAQSAIASGFSGVMLRGSGVLWDIRKSQSYENYSCVSFSVVVGKNGDCYDRYLVRMEEMRESVSIIVDSIAQISCGSLVSNLAKEEEGMEGVIEKYLSSTKGFKLNGSVYVGTESPKGEFGVTLSSVGYSPNRLKIRSPGFFHLAFLSNMCYGHYLADVVTVIGTQDIVFGEIDR